MISAETTDETFLCEAIALARQAREKGNHPFGAVLVIDGTVVASAENTVATDGDSTCHAEMNLVRLAVRGFSREDRQRAALYASTEPCAMCAGAIYWAGLRKVVYGLSAEALGDMTDGSLVIPCRDIFARGRDRVDVVGPLLEEDARSVHVGFWDGL